jgi:hypothetical protein
MTFPKGLSLSAEQAEAVRGMLVSSAPGYPYPWGGLEEELARQGSPGLQLLGYGSLVNRVSAARTLSRQVLRTMEPAVAFGARRIFNYVLPRDSERYGPPEEPDGRAALNVRITGEPSDALNGVLITIPIDEVPALREREVGYELAPAPCLPWPTRSERPFSAYILSCPDGGRFVDNILKPHTEY